MMYLVCLRVSETALPTYNGVLLYLNIKREHSQKLYLVHYVLLPFILFSAVRHFYVIKWQQ